MEIRKNSIERTVVIKQLTDLETRVSKIRNDILFKNYKDINFREFINYLTMYKDFFSSIKK